MLRVPKGILPAGALLPLEEKVGTEVFWMLWLVGGVGKLGGGLLEKRAPASHR